MIRKSIVLAAALVTLAPAALLAADPASAPVHGPRGDGQWFNRLDTNHDGVITKDEATAASEARREAMKAEAAARFKAADKNGDGLLSKEEAAAGMPLLARHFDSIDTNKDGQVTPEEAAASRAHFRGGRNGRSHDADPVPDQR